MTYSTETLRGETDLLRIREVARLHKVCLPDTLNSVRGEKTIEQLYQRLLFSDGQIYVALCNGLVVGCVAVTMDYFSLANVRSVVNDFTSWIRPLIKRSPNFICGSLLDSLSISRFLKSRQTQFAYVVTVFVAPEFQGRGIATTLLKSAISDLRPHTDIIMIDTEKVNTGAQGLYQSLQFVKVYSTTKSYIFELQQELH